MNAPGRALVFVGFMGTGKSLAARQAASALGLRAVDSDLLLEQRLGHSIAEEFERNGEAAFRAREEELVLELLRDAGPDTAISLGGGSVLSQPVRRALTQHVAVLLELDPVTGWERVSRAGGGRESPTRPLARGREAFVELHAQRRELYESIADAFIPVRSRGAVPNALASLRRLADAPAGTRMLWASASSGQYPVFLGRGLLSSALWPVDRASSRGFAVTDANVAPLHGASVDWAQHTIAIEAGEQHKTLATAELVWNALIDAGMTKSDHVVALGGGVVGDLAGFCAATYQRGVAVVQLPTTLVAQVDSAYGGKTGVDLPAAKNYVGAYHQPAGVLVDPDVLRTLPATELAAGYAEVFKTALIAGGQLWQKMLDDQPVDDATILACARTKLGIVARDERDAGARQVLNLGHTVGHAIEAASGYRLYRHGEAVALGLLAALRLSEQPELLAVARERLAGHGLPVRLEGVDVEAVLTAIGRDKKRSAGRVPFVLVRAPGDVRPGADVPAAALRAAVLELTS